MTPSFLLFTLILTGVAIGGYLLWNATNRAGYRRRMQQNQSPKSGGGGASDRMQLSPQQKKILKRALEIAQSGQVKPAALLLEQSGLQRQCIDLLERSGLIDEAAGVLIKMQKQNRAGYIYARNGKWLKAAECFKTANLPAEAAKCLQKAEKFEDAAAQYIAAEMAEEAAVCYQLLMRWHDAGKLFIKLNQPNKARKAYERFFLANGSTEPSDFENSEITLFRDAVVEGVLNQSFIEVLARAGKLVELVRALLKSSKIDVAATIYTKSVVDLGPLLMSEVNLQSGEGRLLAEMFLVVKNFKFAGMVFEQIGDYQRAAVAFEEIEDIERACYCYERAGDKASAKSLRIGRRADRPLNASSVPGLASHLFDDQSAGNTGDETSAIGSEGLYNSGNSDPVRRPSLGAGRSPDSLGVKVGAGVFALDPLSQANSSPLDEDRLLFHKCSLFEDLDFQQKTRIWELGAIEKVAKQSVLVDVSDEPKGLYFVLEGELDCILNSDAGEIPLETLGAGDIFGELWLLSEQPASVRLVARSDSRLLIIDRTKFVGLLDQDGTMARKVYKHFTHRLLGRLLNPLKSQALRQAS